MSIAGSSGGAAGGVDDAGTMAVSQDTPIDYGARGPYEVVIEKNVGEEYRNTNLTDDAARCASLVAGLGTDADGGDWATYPADMDRQLYTLFRPTTLDEGKKYPIITWGGDRGRCLEDAACQRSWRRR